MTKTRICSVDGCGKRHKAHGYCANHYAKLRKYGSALVVRHAAPGDPFRFLQRAARSDTNECIIWPFATGSHGHGVICIDGKNRPAHAVCLEMAIGPPPFEGAHALHKPVECHNPSCVNPKHLRWGDAGDNVRDRVLDGTSNRGEQQGRSVLTEADVRFIRKTKVSAPKLAEKFNVTVWTIYDVRKRRSWSWLKD